MKIIERHKEAFERMVHINVVNPMPFEEKLQCGVIGFMVGWANAMELCLERGERLTDEMIDKACSKADEIHRVSGSVVGWAAVQIAHFWTYGSEFSVNYNRY